MDLDSFLASPRWEILQIISKHPSSPIEIAKELKTTVSYVSQQLKLLEAAGLVKKQRTGAVEKGKPRNIFSIAKESVYLIPLVNGFEKKRLLELTDYHKTILRIWFIENPELHYPVEKFFWKIENYLNEIDFLYIEISSLKSKIIIVSDSKSIKQKIDVFLKKSEIDYELISKKELEKKDSEKLYLIYPTLRLPDSQIELKGGKEKHEQ